MNYTVTKFITEEVLRDYWKLSDEKGDGTEFYFAHRRTGQLLSKEWRKKIYHLDEGSLRIVEIGDYRGQLVEHKALYALIQQHLENSAWEDGEDWSTVATGHYGHAIEIKVVSDEQLPTSIFEWWESSEHKKLWENLNEKSDKHVRQRFVNFVTTMMEPGSQVGYGSDPQTIERNQWLSENQDATHPVVSRTAHDPDLNFQMRAKVEEVLKEELMENVANHCGWSMDGYEYMEDRDELLDEFDIFYRWAQESGIIFRELIDGDSMIGVYSSEEYGTLHELAWLLVLSFSGNLVKDEGADHLDGLPRLAVDELNSWPVLTDEQKKDAFVKIHDQNEMEEGYPSLLIIAKQLIVELGASDV